MLSKNCYTVGDNSQDMFAKIISWTADTFILMLSGSDKTGAEYPSIVNSTFN